MHDDAFGDLATGVCEVEGTGLSVLDWRRDDDLGLVTTDGDPLRIGFHPPGGSTRMAPHD